MYEIYDFGKWGLAVMPGLSLNSWVQMTLLVSSSHTAGLQAYLIMPGLGI